MDGVIVFCDFRDVRNSRKVSKGVLRDVFGRTQLFHIATNTNAFIEPLKENHLHALSLHLQAAPTKMVKLVSWSVVART